MKLGKILGGIGNAVLGGIPGIIGGIGSALLDRSSARQQQGFNAGEAQKQRDFEERMSSTSWQRGVADMRAAGINPLLSFEQGGASTPGGAAASGQAADYGNVVSSALQAQQFAAQMKLLAAKAEAAHEKAGRDRTEANKTAAYWLNSSNTLPSGALRPLMAQLVDNQMKSLSASARAALANARLFEADLPARRVTGGKWAGIVRGFIGPLANSARAISAPF